MKWYKKLILVLAVVNILIFASAFIWYALYNWAIIPVIENYFTYTLPNIGYGFFIFILMFFSMLSKVDKTYDLEDPALYAKIFSKIITNIVNFGIIMLITLFII